MFAILSHIRGGALPKGRPKVLKDHTLLRFSMCRWRQTRLLGHAMRSAGACRHRSHRIFRIKRELLLERYFYRAIVDDYQQSWDGLRRQIRAVLWEEAVRQTGVPQYLGAPDDLKLLLMKAQNRKAGSHAYRVHDRSRLSFQGHWYVCPGLLNRLQGKDLELYYDRRDISVIYLFVEGSYVGEAYCQAFMGQRVSEWEAAAMRKHDREKAKEASSASAEVRARMQEEIEETKKQRRRASRAREQARQLDRQREEIHPPHVLEALESLAPDARESLRLPKATPDPPKEYPGQ